MLESLTAVAGKAYSRVPPRWRPPLKRAFLWTTLRGQGLLQRRRVQRGRRVEFLDFEIAHLEPYEMLGAGAADVFVRATASCVSPGTERAVLCGLPGARRRFPYTPGYSTVGEVVDAGHASGFNPGDRVAGRMPHASHGVLSRPSLFRVPASVADDDASMIELGIICLQGVRKARILPGERVAIVGQGLIGQLAARLARLAGAGTVTAIAASRRRAEIALRPGGADRFLALADDPNAVDTLGADVVIEAVGSSAAIALAMRAARKGGRVILLGSSRDLGRDLDWWTLAQERELALVGAHIGVLPERDQSSTLWTYEQEGVLFLSLLEQSRLEVRDLITWRPSPGDCNKVYEVLANGGGEHVAIVFEWSQNAAGA